MPNLVEQQEARRRERREQEREQERREERLEALREQAREEQRERDREERLRQEALDQARAYAEEDDRRRLRHERTVLRLRQERRIRSDQEEHQFGRTNAAREAARVVRRAVTTAAAAESTRLEQAHAAALADDRQRERADGRRQQRRSAERAQQRTESYAADQREAAHHARLSEQQVDTRRAAAEDRNRDERSADRRAEESTRAGAERRRDAARSSRRTSERASQRTSERASDRRTQQQSDQRQQRRDAERTADRAADRSAGRAAERAAERRDTDRVAERAAARAAERAEGQRSERIGARREGERVRQRTEDRAAELRRLAVAQRRAAAQVGSRGAVTAIRVHGPLLLDASGAPVRLRGIELPPLAKPADDATDSLPVPEAQLDELVRWGATALALPIGVDDLLSPPAAPTDPTLLPDGAVEQIARQQEPDEDLLAAAEAHVAAAATRGLVTVLQLGPLRPPNDGRLVDISALGLFWRTLARRFENEPSVVYNVLPGPTTALHPVQFGVVANALAAEVRRIAPGAVVVLESPAGDVPAPRTALAGVIYGVRVAGDLAAPTLAAIATRARTAPVVVFGWGDRGEIPPQSAVGRRLASVGAHWLCPGWPEPASLDVPGRLRAFAPGLSVLSGLAEPDRLVGTSRTGDEPADVGPPTTLVSGSTAGLAEQRTDGSGGSGSSGGGFGGGPSLLGVAGLLNQLLIGAVPQAAASPAPPIAAHRYLPSRTGLQKLVSGANRAQRDQAVQFVRDFVAPRYLAAQNAGLLVVLGRVRATETQVLRDLPAVPATLTGIPPTKIKPEFLRERLLIDGEATIGTHLVTGVTAPHDVTVSAATTTEAIISLLQLDDVLSRMLAVERAAVATAASRALVMALYRTEGALGMPPSSDRLAQALPSGASSEKTSISHRADISQLVWIGNAAAFSSITDAAGIAIGAFMLQIAGLDVVSGKTWAQYESWSQGVWAAVGPSPVAGAAARRLILQNAVAGEKKQVAKVAHSDAFVLALRNPVEFTTTVLSDGVQLLRGNRSPQSLFGIGPLPPGAPTELSLGLAYIRYNTGDVNTRRLLASALIAAAQTKQARWAPLRQRIDAATLAAITTAAAAARKATRGMTNEKLADRLQSEAVWIPLRPWCEISGNLDALEDFINVADSTMWSSGWFPSRANAARFRILLRFYAALFNP